MRTRLYRSFTMVCTVFALLSTAIPVIGAESPQAAKSDSTLILTEENDWFAGKDENYTNGIKLNWISGDLKHYAEDDRLPRFLLPYLRILPFVNDEGQQYNVGIALGQNMYVPHNTRTTIPQTNDRPYAGWTYLALAVHAKTPTKLDSFETTLGMVGPAALAGETQNAYHALIGSPRVEGWNNQIHNEPGVMLTWQRTMRVARAELGRDFAWDFLPHVRATVGNVMTQASAGFETRIGYRLPWDFGTSLIQPGGGVSVPAAEDDPRIRQDSYFGLHIFAGAEGKAVARNIFLDGNTWQNSPSIPKKPFVADLSAGVGLVLGRAKLTYTQVYRTQEFESQKNPQVIGSITLAVTF